MVKAMAVMGALVSVVAVGAVVRSISEERAAEAESRRETKCVLLRVDMSIDPSRVKDADAVWMRANCR